MKTIHTNKLFFLLTNMTMPLLTFGTNTTCEYTHFTSTPNHLLLVSLAASKVEPEPAK